MNGDERQSDVSGTFAVTFHQSGWEPSMKILIVGSGAREHALAWKVAQSPRVAQLYVAPGNAGTALLAENVPISVQDIAALVDWARAQRPDLVLVGPEAPLAAGLADALRAQAIRVFGPSHAAAQLEASKRFAKDFMRRHAIPTARFAALDDFDAALEHVRAASYPVVIKASGLAAGKGVILPESLAEARAALSRLMQQHEFGAAGDQVVIEERLVGDEVSLLAFTDGKTVKPMLPAQDHKRLLDGDRGPNTGGMGAYAPVPLDPELVSEITRTILQPTIDGMRAEGNPFVGVLYAGLMLTAQGPRVLEFNCRFGDPETEVVLPLLASDLVDVVEACVNGTLAACPVEWKDAAAACVVLASGGYPGKYETGLPISGLDAPLASDAVIFHAGTRWQDRHVVTAGGRVLTVTGWGATLDDALDTAYATVAGIAFEGMQYRRDIAMRARERVQ